MSRVNNKSIWTYNLIFMNKKRARQGEIVFLLCFGFESAHKWCMCSVLYHVYEKLWNSMSRVQEVQDIGLILALNWE